MTPAKPQQMTGQKDDPDDLIAELTKLMATDNRANAATDTSPASTGTPAVRIPGQPTIRIPGGDPSAAGGAGSPAPGKFDFGQPTRPALSPSTPAPQPGSWQSRLGGKPDPDPLAAFDAPTTARQPNTPPASWRPAVAPEEAPTPSTAPAFDFDFGFNRERPAAGKPAPQPTTSLRPSAP